MGKVSSEATKKNKGNEKASIHSRVQSAGMSLSVPASRLRTHAAKAASAEQPVAASNAYRVEDILRMGKENFFKQAAPQQPVPIPDLGFTEEEGREIDQLVARKGK